MRIISWMVRIVLFAVVLGVGAFAGLVTAAFPELPKLESSEELRRLEGRIYARDGKTMLRRLRGPTSRRYSGQREISPVLEAAVIAAEDRRFESHVGIDPRAIARAAWADLRAGELQQGGSTITQQLVKNAYVGPERSATRKTREAMLAVALETRWSKRRILTAYLNVAYFGRGTYGIRDASQLWFRSTPRRLTPAQAALAAAMLRSPELYDPLRARALAKERRDGVLRTMHEMGALTDEQLRVALATPLPDRRQVKRNARAGAEIAPHFTDDIVSELAERYGTATALGGGLRVETSLDARLQRAANESLRQLDGTGLSAALVTLDVASGEVRALAVGGPARDDAFNLVTGGRRQPGSAFKPFALAAAYAEGYTEDSLFRSAPYRTRWNGDQVTITNDSGLYAGPQKLGPATWNSDNTVYARVAEKVGMDRVIAMARAAGIDAEMTDSPVTVLGALPQGVTPLEIANAYRTFAARGRVRGGAGGAPVMLRTISRRGGSDGRTTTPVTSREVMPTPVADMVTQTLRGVVDRGTGTRAAIGRPAAGKTGTTEDNSDAWFVGYTPKLVTAVWVGHPEARVPMRTEFEGGPVSGGTWPALLWGSYMRSVTEGSRTHDFAVSKVEFVTRRIDPQSRLLADEWCAGAVRERFIKGTEPTRLATDCPTLERMVPDVRHLTAKQAEALLERRGFEVDVRDVVGPPGSLGKILAQVPGPGASVSRDEAVRLLIVGREVGQ